MLKELGVAIGHTASSAYAGVATGANANVSGIYGIAIGNNANASEQASIAIGKGAAGSAADGVKRLVHQLMQQYKIQLL